jgi:hypothetical protein
MGVCLARGATIEEAKAQVVAMRDRIRVEL